jgi:predicted TIM-barrel fold metal-dependent hydrolase
LSTQPGTLPSSRPVSWKGAVIDCDVHANVPSLDVLLPHMDPVWTQWVRERAWKGPVGNALTYPPNAPTTARAEWRPADGRVPASDVDLLREHVLDPWDVERAIVSCYYAFDSVRHPDLAAALASAVNDWLIEEWVQRDERLSASLVLPPRDPNAMLRELQRVGDHPAFVQVVLPVRSDRLYGSRIFHPLYREIARRDLVLGIYWGGTPEGAPTPTGWPSWYAEEYAAEWQAYAAQLTSLIAEGVFQAVPNLRVSFFESGFTWIPVWGWRMNKEWKGLRREVPWIDRPPLDILREHMRFSITPTHAPADKLGTIIRWLGSEDLLFFASDYPHGHGEDIQSLLEAVPESMLPKLMADTARTWYRW